MAENKTGKFILKHGIHGGTLMSRDTGHPEQFDTWDEAVAALRKHETWYNSIGYVIWFANIVKPDGTDVSLGGNANYR